MCPHNNEAEKTPELTLHEEDIEQEKMDPRLQHLVLKADEGRELDPVQASASEETGERWVDIGVVLVESDGEVPPEIEVLARAGRIITGRALVENVEKIREHENVKRLSASRPVWAEMNFSVPEIRADAPTLRTYFPTQGVDGRDVIVGVVDQGCDFYHPNFRTPGGKSRLLYIWDQRGGHNLPTSPKKGGYSYGREYSQEDINAALQAASAGNDPYYALGYEPDKSHGTFVLDIAAGNGQAPGSHPGVAPAADLIFVHLSAPSWHGTQSFGNSMRLAQAVKYIFDKAEELGKPAVVNLSMATNGAPHDGTTDAELFFDELLEGREGRAIVIAAGNVYNRSIHSSGQVTSQQAATLEWEITSTSTVEQEVEIWYSGDDELEVELVTKWGDSLGPIKVGTTTSIKDPVGVSIGRIIHNDKDPINNDKQIDILLDCSSSDYIGTWEIKLHPAGNITNGTFHAWIERDNRFASRFNQQCADPDYTIGSIATGKWPIVVGSYDARSSSHPLSLFSSAGPTRDGRGKPELSAPGQSIVAARSIANSSYPPVSWVMEDSGTSYAAPHVAGLIALMMQQRDDLSVERIREIVMQTARKDSLVGSAWHLRYGAGRVDGSAALASLLGVPVPPIPSIAEVTIPVGTTFVPGGVSPGISVQSSGFAPLVRELADVASDTKVRLRFTLELEPLAGEHVVVPPDTRVGRGREPPLIAPEDYLALLKSTARNLRNLNAARKDISPLSASADSIDKRVKEQVAAVTQKARFWHPDCLFDDYGQTIPVNGRKVEVVEIPGDYLAFGTDRPELIDQILLAELDFIDAMAPETCIPADAVAAGILPSWEQFVQMLKDLPSLFVEPKVDTAAPNLSSFLTNWENALNQLKNQTTSAAGDVLSSLVPLKLKWDDVAHWLKVFGNKLPKEILKLPLRLKLLIRTLVKGLEKVRSKFHLPFDLPFEPREMALNSILGVLRTQGVKYVANALWQTDEAIKQVKREGKNAAKRLHVSKRADLSKKHRVNLEECLRKVEDTVHGLAWDMFYLSKIAWVAGLILPLPELAAAEPGPFVELGIGSIILSAWVLIAILGEDALHDCDDFTGRYQGIGDQAIRTLKTLKR